MPKENRWNKSVPRVEYDHRAREARLQLERVERLPSSTAGEGLPTLPAIAPSCVQHIRERPERATHRAPSNQRPCPISAPLPVFDPPVDAVERSRCWRDIPQFFALQDPPPRSIERRPGHTPPIVRLRLCGFQIFSRRELTAVENDGVRDERIGHRSPLDTAAARCAPL